MLFVLIPNQEICSHGGIFHVLDLHVWCGLSTGSSTFALELQNFMQFLDA